MLASKDGLKCYFYTKKRVELYFQHNFYTIQLGFRTYWFTFSRGAATLFGVSDFWSEVTSVPSSQEQHTVDYMSSGIA